MKYFNNELINHVWKKCINSSEGRSLFHGNTLAKEFMESDSDWNGVHAVLVSQNEFSVSVVHIDGISEKVLEVQVPHAYTTDAYKRLARLFANRDKCALEERATFGDMSEEEVKEYKRKFFDNLMDTLK